MEEYYRRLGLNFKDVVGVLKRYNSVVCSVKTIYAKIDRTHSMAGCV
jgi:hypothetical protein